MERLTDVALCGRCGWHTLDLARTRCGGCGAVLGERRLTDAELTALSHTCECGRPGTEVCYRRGSDAEIWFCADRKHDARVREMAAQGWLSQSGNVAASPTGIAIRRHLQSLPA